MAALERTATCLLVVFLIGCCQINLALAAHKKSNEDWSNHNELDVISKAGMTPMATSWQRDGAPAATTQQQDHFKAKYGSPLVRDMSAPITDGAAQQQMAKDAVQYANGFLKDSAYSPYPLDAPKQAHSNLKQRNYQAASFPEAGERDQAAMPNNAASGKSLHPMSTKGMDADSQSLQADYAAPVMVKAGRYDGDYASYAGYPRQVGSYPYADQHRTVSPRMNPQCNPCGPPPCPPCPPLPPPPAPPVPCVTEIPLCIQYLINLIVIILGLGILKWYCSAMSELDRECGLDDRASGGHDKSLATRKSSFSPPMATISAYYDPATNQVLLPHEHQHYQFTR